MQISQLSLAARIKYVYITASILHSKRRLRVPIKHGTLLTVDSSMIGMLEARRADVYTVANNTPQPNVPFCHTETELTS